MATPEKILILDRGDAEISYRSDWIFRPDPAGHCALTDPTDSCTLELSCLRLPAPGKELPSPAVQLAHVLAGNPEAGKDPKIESHDRGDLWYAEAEYGYAADDTDRGERREARSRIAVAMNARFQALLTFHYWADDRAWALPAFERMLATLRLGDGRRLARPGEHWSLRE